MRIRFITATPLNVHGGSGTYVGIHVLASALEALGHAIDYETPLSLGVPRLPVFTAERLLFNRRLRESGHELTVGFDMDGYRLPGGVAALKGVIADEVRFERGWTRRTMALQARCERLHVRRAGRVLATSAYSAGQAREFYGLERTPEIVPEPIDLEEWQRLLAQQPAGDAAAPFRVLFVGRFYRRKRVDVLLRAAALLRGRAPGLEIRIVGNGPCAGWLHELARELRLGASVTWLGDVSRADLAREYAGASVFCLPSVQEGFGIVLLEAMAAGKPIVAARAAAIPEVAPHAALVEPDNAEALAAAIERLHGAPEARAAQARTGAAWVAQFDAAQVARRFLEAATGVKAARA